MGGAACCVAASGRSCCESMGSAAAAAAAATAAGVPLLLLERPWWVCMWMPLHLSDALLEPADAVWCSDAYIPARRTGTSCQCWQHCWLTCPAPRRTMPAHVTCHSNQRQTLTTGCRIAAVGQEHKVQHQRQCTNTQTEHNAGRGARQLHLTGAASTAQQRELPAGRGQVAAGLLAVLPAAG